MNRIQLFSDGFGVRDIVDLWAWVHLRFKDTVGTFVGVDRVVVGDVSSEFVVEKRGIDRLPLIEALIHHNGFSLESLTYYLLDFIHLGQSLRSDQKVLFHEQLLTFDAIDILFTILISLLSVLCIKKLILVIVLVNLLFIFLNIFWVILIVF